MTFKDIYIFPYYRQTLVSAFSQEQILERLMEVTKEHIEAGYLAGKYEFNGRIGDAEFQLSRMITQPNTFLPLIKGKIESTKAGSILFVTFEMFYTTKILLFIWTVIPFMIFLINLILLDGYFYALLALFFGLFNYVVTLANFHRQRRISMEILNRILS
jgi:hypothetical protein